MPMFPQVRPPRFPMSQMYPGHSGYSAPSEYAPAAPSPAAYPLPQAYSAPPAVGFTVKNRAQQENRANARAKVAMLSSDAGPVQEPTRRKAREQITGQRQPLPAPEPAPEQPMSIDEAYRPTPGVFQRGMGDPRKAAGMAMTAPIVNEIKARAAAPANKLRGELDAINQRNAGLEEELTNLSRNRRAAEIENNRAQQNLKAAKSALPGPLTGANGQPIMLADSGQIATDVLPLASMIESVKVNGQEVAPSSVMRQPDAMPLPTPAPAQTPGVDTVNAPPRPGAVFDRSQVPADYAMSGTIIDTTGDYKGNYGQTLQRERSISPDQIAAADQRMRQRFSAANLSKAKDEADYQDAHSETAAMQRNNRFAEDANTRANKESDANIQNAKQLQMDLAALRAQKAGAGGGSDQVDPLDHEQRIHKLAHEATMNQIGLKPDDRGIYSDNSWKKKAYDNIYAVKRKYYENIAGQNAKPLPGQNGGQSQGGPGGGPGQPEGPPASAAGGKQMDRATKDKFIVQAGGKPGPGNPPDVLRRATELAKQAGYATE